MFTKINRKLLALLFVFIAACSQTPDPPTPIPPTTAPTAQTHNTPTPPLPTDTPPPPPTNTPIPSTPTNTPIPPSPTATTPVQTEEFPPPRGFTQLVLHPPSGKMILFGGESNSRGSYEDTWEYDPATNVWTERFPENHPSDADGSSAVYDSESDKFIFYFSVALDSSAPNGIRGISETWAYDFDTNTWENMDPPTHPEGLMGPRMAYDAESDRTILFGGADFSTFPGPTFTETWAYDYNANQWQQMNPSQTPIGRSYFGMAYAPDQDQVFVFGGSIQEEDEDRQNELWAYDYNSDTWTQIPYSGEPNHSHHPAMVYNPQVNQLWYLVDDDMRAFDLTNQSWEILAPRPTNISIYFHAMAVDTEGNLIVFGGGPSGLTYNNDSYKFSLTTQEWEQLNE